MKIMSNEHIQCYSREIKLRDDVHSLQEALSNVNDLNDVLKCRSELLNKSLHSHVQLERLLKEKINILISSIKDCHKLTKAKWYYDFWTEIKKQHKDILVEENLVEASKLATENTQSEKSE